MSEPRSISPLLDGLVVGEPISDSHGVRCCPAMNPDTGDKYIVKIISVPASAVQLEALLLTGAYPDAEAALAYFRTVADDTLQEAGLMQRLAAIDGFAGFEGWQIAEHEDGSGYSVYLLSKYRPTLERHLARNPMTHLSAVNLGLDLCAALAVSRQSGYLYVALKPDNIYLLDEGYRIGDLGFISLDSLKYASLPEKYRSAYTAPEITDAYSALNETVDIYAVGLILYQAYNNGELPTAADGSLPPPAYADYEMAEIILKACAANPDERWQTPEEMGQAIAGYLQRNAIGDDPIVPPVIIEEPDPEEEAVEEDVPAEEGSSAEAILETVPELEDAAYLIDDETAPSEQIAAELDSAEVTDEVSEMLLQADDLIDHKVPDPVVAPEPVEVEIPPIEIPEPEPVEAEELQPEEEQPSEQQDEASREPQPEPEPEEEPLPQKAAEPEPEAEYCDDSAEREKRSSRKFGVLIGVLVTVLVLLIAAIGGLFYYENYYLQTVRGISLSGDEDYLTVTLDTDVDNSLLTVVCKDTYGNTKRMAVTNNVAHFTGLNPDSQYKVTVEISGFHKLIGSFTDSHTTGPRTNITSFSAITGAEAGSVILSFTAEGQDGNAWRLVYSTAGEQERSLEFTGNHVTVTGLTVGSEYTFELIPIPEQYVIGTPILKYTPSQLIFAENLQILGFENGALNVSWSCPEGITVNSWSVRCYSDSGYDTTVTVADCKASFPGLDPANGYTVDVTAENMSVSSQTFVSAGSITFKQLQLDDSVKGQLAVSWDFEGTAPDDGWLLLYTVNGGESHVIRCDTNSGTISPLIPGANYAITVQPTSGSTVFGGTGVFTAPGGGTFSSYGVSASSFGFRMCWTPADPTWKWYDLWEKDFTTVFSPGERASFIFNTSQTPAASNDTIEVLFVIKDAGGNVYSINGITKNWGTMWNNNYAELDIPALPSAAGSYTMDIYFNDAYVTTQSFSIS